MTDAARRRHEPLPVRGGRQARAPDARAAHRAARRRRERRRDRRRRPALEITHLGSLYHDDVMDDADKRRGVPSAQAVWGNSVAILTGDLLFSRASQLMARLGERAIRLQADTFERLVLGQMHETIGPQDGRGPDRALPPGARRQDRLAHRRRRAVGHHLLRTARREYRAAARARSARRSASPSSCIDDVIDLSAEPDETGKVPGTDLRAGVPTLPYLAARTARRMPHPLALLRAHRRRRRAHRRRRRPCDPRRRARRAARARGDPGHPRPGARVGARGRRGARAPSRRTGPRGAHALRPGHRRSLQLSRDATASRAQRVRDTKGPS